MTRGRSGVFHVNMLKEYWVRRPIETSFWIEPESAEDIDDSDVLLWNDSPEGQPTLRRAARPSEESSYNRC